MKFVAIIEPKKKNPVTAFVWDGPGKVPPVVVPEGEDEEKDTEPPKPEPKAS